LRPLKRAKRKKQRWGGGEERERNEKNIFGPKNKTRKDRRRLRHEISIYYGGGEEREEHCP
jgi:hypothetical protein